MRILLAALAALLVTATTASAQTQDSCKTLQLVSAVDLDIRDNRVTVPVNVNGQPTRMMLATAAGITSFTATGAAALGLHPIANSNVILLSKTDSSESFVQADDFAVGTLHVPRGQFMVLPGTDTGDSNDATGLIGGDLLSRYDVEMDFAGRKLSFFLHDHCPGKVIYWKHAAAAMVPLSEQQPTPSGTRTGYLSYVQRAAEMWVPVTLDGKPLPAILNTGYPTSTMSASTARSLGVEADSPGSSPLPGTAPDSHLFQHTFSSLVFDGVSVSNPHFVIYPDNLTVRSRDWQRTDTRLNRIYDGVDSRIAIGMDILRRLHLFASFGEHRLYITEAGPSAPPAGAAKP